VTAAAVLPGCSVLLFNLLALEQEMKSVRPVRVFAASPGDTAEERNIITAIVDEINRDDGRREGYRIDLLLWEQDSYSDVGVDAQEVITRQIGDYDIFLGFMSTRFGSPTKRSNSGTEEEFNRAFDKYLQEPNSIKILFFFRNPTVKLSEIDPYQVLQVRRFRDRIARLGVWFFEYERVEGTRSFRELVRRHLAHAVRDLVHGESKVAHSRRVNQAGSRVATVELEDWTAATQYSPYAQSASYREVPLSQYSDSYFSLQGNFQSESSYFRFGFKLLTMAAPAIGDTTIQSSQYDNLVLHIGKNTRRDEVFFTIYRGALRVGPDQRFLNYRDHREIPIEISVSQDDVCRLIVDNVKLYEKQISHDIKGRLLLVAWGDEHEYEVHFRNIRLEFA
jgi:hypothetical protein